MLMHKKDVKRSCTPKDVPIMIVVKSASRDTNNLVASVYKIQG